MNKSAIECPFCKRYTIPDSRGLLARHAAWNGKGTCPGASLTPEEARKAKVAPTKDPGFTI